MIVTSPNWTKGRKMWAGRAWAVGAYLVVENEQHTTYFNDQGQEVFQVLRDKKSLWERLKEAWNANAIH